MNNKLYKNKYRVQSARLLDWDYTWDGYYFVTICTKNRQMFFGNVVNEKMILNNVGKIAVYKWLKTSRIRKNIKLDEFIIMPNHIHGIIIINNGNNDDLFDKINHFFTHPTRPARVETPHHDKPNASHLFDNNDTPHNINDPHRGVSTSPSSSPSPSPRWKPGSLGVIINQFKSTATKRIRKINPHFAWQPRFHDRIIRDEQGLFNARQYIINNPEKWWRNRNNKEGLGM